MSSMFDWAVNPAATGVVGNLAYDALKKLSNSFVNRFRKFFKSEDDTHQYYEGLCNEKSNNPKKPHRDVEDLYETISQSTIDARTSEELIGELRSWLNENQDFILKIGVHQHDNTFTMNIGSQKAKQIINVQGTANFNEIK